MPSLTPIPTVLRIDIEPDEFQPEVGQKPWEAFVSMATLTEELRERLATRSGDAFHPTWFLRLDPDIERCFGRVDFVVHRHGNLFDRLVAHSDPLGIHVSILIDGMKSGRLRSLTTPTTPGQPIA
jgi:hypothetical protein